MILRSPLALALALALTLVWACTASPRAGSSQPRPPETTAAAPPPRFPITSTERYDPSAVPAYQGAHPDVYAHIDANLPAHLANLQRWVRQPSVSAENIGVQEMARMLRDDLVSLGFREAELVPTSGHPGVFGHYDAGAPRTLVIYMMYDVQPVVPDDWRVAPFDGAIVDHALGKVLMARGATNQKGPQRAFLNALESIIATRGKLPVNLLVVAEGEEELGSPNYPEVIAKYADRLRRANGVLFPFNSQQVGGRVTMFLGVKGITYFELEARGDSQRGPKNAEIHGSYKAITDAPAWRLTQALSTLVSRDGNTILVPGYHDAIRPPNAEEQKLFNGMLADWIRNEPAMRAAMGIDRWIGGWTGAELLSHYLFDTTLNIDGMWSGYTGPGVKTILPHRATAKLDSRLVPDQTPDEALRLIRAHLDANGFQDIELRKLSGYPPAQTSVTAPLVQAAIGVYNKHGLTPSIAPRLAGSAPYYVFTETLQLPLVAGGIGHGTGAHGPNELMVVEPAPGSPIAGLAQIEKFYVDLLYALAEK
jgi:acetylornithine deacetylase/succinyl-diaminopimelate desuccinylase-like protein